MSGSLAPDVSVPRLTRDRARALVDAGMLREGSPIELIDGLLVAKDRSAFGEDPMTIGKKHNLVVQLLARLSAELDSHGCYIQTQGPLELSDHDEPEPDGLVLRGEPHDYADRIPSAADALAVIEIADSSLGYDRSVKLALYAHAGIPQYLIVNLRNGCVEVYEDPSPEGSYAAPTILRGDALISLKVGPQRRLEIAASRIVP
jgi:Uma2 family endonuclease